jgi:hypothetical protein
MLPHPSPPGIRHVEQHRTSDVKPRHLPARIAAVVTAAAAIGMFLGPARADASDHDDPDGTVNRDSTSAMAADIDSWGNRDLDIGALSSDDWIGSRVDGWANRDIDIGAFNSAMAEELRARLDGYDTPDMDLNPTDLWEAMAFGTGSRVDGWANPDVDIGAF